MPKRGAIALLLTAGALAFLLSFRTPDSTVAGRPGQIAVVSPAPLATARAESQERSTAGATPAGPTGSTPRATAAPTAPTATAGPDPTPGAVSAATALNDGTYTGDSIAIRWGSVQVQVTVAGGRIVAIEELDMPYSDRRTRQITDVATPILREQALEIQGANVDMISGATFTSRAYAESLQSALDQAAREAAAGG